MHNEVVHSGNDLEWVLVTGSSSGIGKHVAVELSRHYRLILHGRDHMRLEETRTQCHVPSQHVIWRCDLSSIETVTPSLQTMLAEAGVRIIGFVHCAATLKVLPLRAQSLSAYRDNLNVNFLSAVEITSTLTRKKFNDGKLKSVVFISSIASMHGAKGFGAYSASKGALDSFMRVMAIEFAPDIRFNSVLPGAIMTPMTSTMFEDPQLVEKFTREYPLGVGRPQDIFEVVDFLLSDRSRWITGQQFVVDGGRTANITA